MVKKKEKGKRKKAKRNRAKGKTQEQIGQATWAGNAIRGRPKDCTGGDSSIANVSKTHDFVRYVNCDLECGMSKPYDWRERSFLFAWEIVKFTRVVARSDFILSRLAKQLVDADMSIGANLAGSSSGQTKPDFISKQFVALKEARETRYWLRLIAKSEPSFARAAAPRIMEASEFVAMLTTRLKRARSSANRGPGQV